MIFPLAPPKKGIPRPFGPKIPESRSLMKERRRAMDGYTRLTLFSGARIGERKKMALNNDRYPSLEAGESF